MKDLEVILLQVGKQGQKEEMQQFCPRIQADNKRKRKLQGSCLIQFLHWVLFFKVKFSEKLTRFGYIGISVWTGNKMVRLRVLAENLYRDLSVCVYLCFLNTISWYHSVPEAAIPELEANMAMLEGS